MAQKRLLPPTLQPRRLVPWLVKKRDIGRYLGRAMAACKKGRVIIFYHKYKGRNVPLIMSRVRDRATLCPAACLDFASGRYRKVVLADLPKLSHR